MIAYINGYTVQGTPHEIKQFMDIVDGKKPKHSYQVNVHYNNLSEKELVDMVSQKFLERTTFSKVNI